MTFYFIFHKNAEGLTLEGWSWTITKLVAEVIAAGENIEQYRVKNEEPFIVFE